MEKMMYVLVMIASAIIIVKAVIYCGKKMNDYVCKIAYKITKAFNKALIKTVKSKNNKSDLDQIYACTRSIQAGVDRLNTFVVKQNGIYISNDTLGKILDAIEASENKDDKAVAKLIKDEIEQQE